MSTLQIISIPFLALFALWLLPLAFVLAKLMLPLGILYAIYVYVKGA